MKQSSEKVKIQPPLLAMMGIALAFVLGLLIPLPLAVAPVLRTVGFVLATLGFLLGLGALIAFRQARKNSGGPRLVTSGVYRISRHPVYLGFVFMLVGLPLNAGSYWGLGLAPAMMVAFNWFVIEPEEKFLTSRFGEEYETYKKRVRRWL